MSLIGPTFDLRSVSQVRRNHHFTSNKLRENRKVYIERKKLFQSILFAQITSFMFHLTLINKINIHFDINRCTFITVCRMCAFRNLLSKSFARNDKFFQFKLNRCCVLLRKFINRARAHWLYFIHLVPQPLKTSHLNTHITRLCCVLGVVSYCRHFELITRIERKRYHALHLIRF